jgi:hypothetical protein
MPSPGAAMSRWIPSRTPQALASASSRRHHDQSGRVRAGDLTTNAFALTK